jgi:hypothetical protein
MSSFFKSAAMSLLSRTLQALLYKYLSDVDVEGIALPSFSGSNDSGWGVRLCNVKLRGGATIMTLPGKIRKKTRTKTETKPEETKQGINNSQAPENDLRKRVNTTSKCSIETNDVKERPDEIAMPSFHGDSCNSRISKNKGTEEINIPEFHRESTVPKYCDSKNELQTATTEQESVVDTESVQSGISDSKETRGGWFSSWFYGTSASKLLEENCSKASKIESERRKTVATAANDVALANSYSSFKENDYARTSNIEVRSLVEIASESSTEYSDMEKKGTDNADNDEEFLHAAENTSGEHHETHHDEEEPTMMLQLGQGCFIGTLDIRLIGKTIHIMVEDAFLTLEVIQQTQSATDGGRVSSTTEKKEKLSPALKTTGDRVLAENIIARLLSMIPNLFLRDINIRLVMQDDSTERTSLEDEKSKNDIEEPIFEYGSNDSVVEFVIELLSVTDGDDFLSKFQTDRDLDEEFLPEDSDSGPEADSYTTQNASYHSASSIIIEDSNDFITKRIRTGRGPEGGVTLRIIPAGVNRMHLPRTPLSMANLMWARQAWITESQFIVVRCSGLDMQFRILMGTKSEKSTGYSDFYYDYDESFVDTMLFGGMDSIAPGPQPPPLPPMSGSTTTMSNSIIQGTGDMEAFWGISSSAKAFVTDTNGIQSCGIKSWFHRVARKLVPFSRSDPHLPCEYAAINWIKPGMADRGHLLDSSIPMPGFVCHISVRDPLEVNIDRQNLDTIGDLLSLLTKPKSTSSSSTHDGEVFERSDHIMQNTNFSDAVSDISACSSKGNITKSEVHQTLAGRSADNLHHSQRNSANVVVSDYNPDSGFPAYMQPEKIQIIGIHLADVQLRIHWMKPNRELEDGVSFVYWNLNGKCITLDYQQLRAAERPFQDLRLDVGYGSATEYKGVEKKSFLSVGVRQVIRDIDEITIESFTLNDGSTRSAWPSTAAAMLDIAPPLESLVYEKRDQHALQIRYVSVTDLYESNTAVTKFLLVHVGATAIEIPFQIKNDIFVLYDELKRSIFGDPSNCSPISGDDQNQSKSLLKYSIQLHGGHFCVRPLIDAILPLTCFDGELSSVTGFSFETFLDKIQFKFGQISSGHIYRKPLSIQQLALLPDGVRLRILLFLEDISPLEEALGIKTESNSFLRYRAINKGILSLSKQMTKKKLFENTKSSRHLRLIDLDHADQRQYLISELLKLDNKSLEDLLETNKRKQRQKNRIPDD